MPKLAMDELVFQDGGNILLSMFELYDDEELIENVVRLLDGKRQPRFRSIMPCQIAPVHFHQWIVCFIMTKIKLFSTP
jgi:hypothetical protein